MKLQIYEWRIKGADSIEEQETGMFNDNPGTGRAGMPVFHLLAIFIITAGCNGTEVQSCWSDSPVRVDGERTEWTGVPTSYFKESGVQLGLCNDSEKLYVFFRFAGHRKAGIIGRGGLTIWLDGSGEKKKDFGIRYTGGPPLQEMRGPGTAGRMGSGGDAPPERKQRFMGEHPVMADKITIIDEGWEQPVIVAADGSGGPAAGFAASSGIYTYEFSIPLEGSSDDFHGIDTAPGRTIGIGFEWGGFKTGDRRRLPDGWGDSPDGGRGGTGRGRRGPMGGFRGRQPEKQEIWLKALLASPPPG